MGLVVDLVIHHGIPCGGDPLGGAARVTCSCSEFLPTYQRGGAARRAGEERREVVRGGHDIICVSSCFIVFVFDI